MTILPLSEEVSHGQGATGMPRRALAGQVYSAACAIPAARSGLSAISTFAILPVKAKGMA